MERSPGHVLGGAVVAVVGGANGGLGRPIADALQQRGCNVVRASRTADVAIDLRDTSAGDVLVAAANERFGRLDGVVIAAGIVAFGDLADTDDVVIEELFLTNVLGPLWLAKRVVPDLAATNGFLVNVSGVVAEHPMAGIAAYSASKAAAMAMAAALHREWRRHGVRVIDVRPPHTETGLAGRSLAGTAPRLQTGLDPAFVAERIVLAIEHGETQVPSDAFA